MLRWHFTVDGFMLSLDVFAVSVLAFIILYSLFTIVDLFIAYWRYRK